MKKNSQIIDEYEINKNTILILPISYGNKTFSKIIEVDHECISPFKPLDIVKESCYIFGSSYEGRKQATRRLIGSIHKAPIALSPDIYLFPTSAPNHSSCLWISANHILNYYEGEEKGTVVVKFRNNRSSELPISLRTLETQYFRTLSLQKKLMKTEEEPRYTRLNFHQSAEKRGEYHW